jgi:glycoprotein-N-acetylgalactosamine 3-beta-galactosyltransferase
MNKFLRKTFFVIIVLTISLYQFFVNLNMKKSENNFGINGNKLKIRWPEPKKPRIFCFILTVEKNLEIKANVIVDGWANKCDSYKLITIIPGNLTKQMNFHSKFLNQQTNELDDLLQPPGFVNDTYKKLTDKVFLTLKYLSKKYNDFDWYLKADDDTFIFVDNLRDFLADKNPRQPVTYGYDFKVLVEKGYHSGGGGYVLSREALHRIGSKLHENYTFCPNTGTEDKDVAKCLRKLGVYPNKSIDEMGRERFHPLSMMAHYKGNFPKWLYSYSSNQIQRVIN